MFGEGRSIAGGVMFEMLVGQVAIVAGASGGIGYAVAKELLRHGISVAGIYHNRQIEILSDEYSNHVKFIQYQADIADKQQLKEVLAQIEKDFGKINYVVNSSGIVKDSLFFLMSDSQFDDVINTNLYGCFNLMQCSIPYLLNNHNGAAIVNIASIAGLKGSTGQANYAASKAGMIAMTKVLAKEAGRKNIRVNCVAPGLIQTRMTKNLPEKKIEKDIPLARFGKAEEIASVVLFLLSDGASYINGETIVVDGGMIV